MPQMLVCKKREVNFDDRISTWQHSELMLRIRGKNTGPEKALRKAVWSMHLRYRLQYRIGRFRPDLVFTKTHIAVFVDGCFWHCCPLHGVKPKSNALFWKTKLDRNVQRDADANRELNAIGWTVIRFWEHEIESDVEKCAKTIFNAISEKRLESSRESIHGKSSRKPPSHM